MSDSIEYHDLDLSTELDNSDSLFEHYRDTCLQLYYELKNYTSQHSLTIFNSSSALPNLLSLLHANSSDSSH